MFMPRHRPSRVMSKWTQMFSREFETETLTRFAPVERDAQDRSQRAPTVVIIDDGVRANAGQRSEPRLVVQATNDDVAACAFQTPGASTTAHAKAEPSKTAAAVSSVADPSDLEFDISISVLRKALPGRFSKMDMQARAQKLTFALSGGGDDFIFS